MGSEYPRLHADIHRAHDAFGTALVLAPPEIFDNDEERGYAAMAGVVLCWVLGHPNVIHSDFARILAKTDARLVELGYLPPRGHIHGGASVS
jgi:hypothetical protein